MMCPEPSVASLVKHDLVTTYLEMRCSTPAPPLDPGGGGVPNVLCEESKDGGGGGRSPFVLSQRVCPAADPSGGGCV